MTPESIPNEAARGRRSVRERLGALSRAVASLATTRVAIFREELGAKARLLVGAAIGLTLAFALAGLALLLGTALVAALLARLLGSATAGILAALLLYLAAAAIAGLYGWRALSRVRPMDFPLTAGQIRKDWQTAAGPAGSGSEDSESGEEENEEIQDLAERFRAGSE